MLLFILILRVILSPLSNVFQKQLAEKGALSLFVVAVTYLAIALLFLPFAFSAASLFSASFWITILLASWVDAAGNVLLVKSLETTELSVFGPINAFKPAIAMGLGIFMLGEVPTPKAMLGVFVIILGSILLTLKKEKGRKSTSGLLYRIGGILCSSIGAVLTKKAINEANPEIALLMWAVLALPFFACILLLFYKSRIAGNLFILKENKSTYLWLLLSYGAMQYVTLLSFSITMVGYSLAIFQLSSLISILFGYRYFQEKGILLKIVSALIMILGALLIIFS